MTAAAAAGFTAGVAVAVAPGVRRVTAPNPGVMTGPGTNTYLVGDGPVVVIDPGPDDNVHTDAIVAAVGGAEVAAVVVTHTHPDHSPGAAALQARTGAPLAGFGPRDGFAPDRMLSDGEAVETDGVELIAVHTPGHASNHLCYLLPAARLLFSGDHVMSGSTVVISPPDGDMDAYLESLRRVRALGLRAIAPGHGDLIRDPDAALAALIDHRLAREAKVIAALRDADRSTIDDLVPLVYDDVDAGRHHIARFSLWAHLRRLVAQGEAEADDADAMDGFWHLRSKG